MSSSTVDNFAVSLVNSELKFTADFTDRYNVDSHQIAMQYIILLTSLGT